MFFSIASLVIFYSENVLYVALRKFTSEHTFGSVLVRDDCQIRCVWLLRWHHWFFIRLVCVIGILCRIYSFTPQGKGVECDEHLFFARCFLMFV